MSTEPFGTENGEYYIKARLEASLNVHFGKRAQNAGMLLQHLFRKPVIHVNQVKALTQSTYKTANDLVSDFVTAGILVEMTGNRRNRIFVFDEYLKLF